MAGAWGLAELGSKAEIGQLGLELEHNFSLEDFAAGGWIKSGNIAKFSFRWGFRLLN